MSSRSRFLLRAVSCASALALVLGGAYFLAGNALLARKLDAAARDAGLEVRWSGLRTLYPGDVRADALEIAGPRFSVRASAVRGRIELKSLFGGDVTLTWLRAGDLEVRGSKGISPTRRAHALRPESRAMPAGLFVATSAGPPTRLLIESAGGTLRRLELGNVRVLGEASAELRKLELTEHTASGTAELSIARAFVAAASGTEAVSFRGTLSARLSPANASQPQTAAGAFVIRAELTGMVRDLSELDASLPPVALDNARANAEVRRDPGSEHARGFVEVRASEFALTEDSGVAARLRDVSARAECSHTASCTGSGARYGLSFESPRLDLPRAPLGRAFSVAFRGELVRRDKEAGVLIEGGSLRVARIPATAQAAPLPALSAQLSLRRSEWSRHGGLRLDGSLRAQGDDTFELLDLVRAPPATRWVLAELDAQPFTVSLELSRSPALLALEEIQASASHANARGAVYVAVEATTGALLIERGRFGIGLRLDEDGRTHVRTGASREWLSRAMSRARP